MKDIDLLINGYDGDDRDELIEDNFKVIDQIIGIHPDENFLKADGFDDAIIGVATDFTEPRLIYSVSKCLQILEEEGMDPEDAFEHFTFNVSGGYVGEQTPIWCWDNFFE